LFCELVDADTGAVVPGYDRSRFRTVMNASGAALPLVWDSSTALQIKPRAAAQSVRLRIYFRDATVYSVNVNSGAAPGPSPVPPTPTPTPPGVGPPPPRWTAPMPNASRPLGGYSAAAGAQHIEVHHGVPASGTYNHAAMISWDPAANLFIIAWKNGVEDEDKEGQRIMYSQSSDGLHWTPSNASTILFPDMSTAEEEEEEEEEELKLELELAGGDDDAVRGTFQEQLKNKKHKGQAAALFVGPPIHINGHMYVGASPGVPTGAAEGAQFCLWPDPLDMSAAEGGKRNCGPPGHVQADGTLLMRRVLSSGVHALGPIFWANAKVVPKQWEKASAALGFKLLSDMDSQTKVDIATLGPEAAAVP
tara:strand:- start:1166 stop:2254 length:1089 start_codon:yes stop_codon:yes gene_type:complete